MGNRTFFKALRGPSAFLEGKAKVEGIPIRNTDSGAVALNANLARPAPTVPNDAGVALLALTESNYLFFKRVFDILVSVIALTVFGIFLPLLALIIKLDSPGPVFFLQERVGVNRRRRAQSVGSAERRKILQPGRSFKVFKLRTMGVNAEIRGPQFATENDIRVTRVGRFLRNVRLDEVPQFINVLRGEMSLIGPRPERLVFVRQFEQEIPYYRDRLLVLPGITGLAQVINGYDDGLESVRRKVELDRQYIRNLGLVMEAKIMMATVGVVLKGEGAR